MPREANGKPGAGRWKGTAPICLQRGAEGHPRAFRERRADPVPAVGDPGEGPAWRGDSCTVIRSDFWRGPRPPDRRWTMARELTIWDRLADQFGPEELHGAYCVMRRALAGEIPDVPVDGRIFAGAGRVRAQRCVAFWRALTGGVLHPDAKAFAERLRIAEMLR